MLRDGNGEPGGEGYGAPLASRSLTNAANAAASPLAILGDMPWIFMLRRWVACSSRRRASASDRPAVATRAESFEATVPRPDLDLSARDNKVLVALFALPEDRVSGSESPCRDLRD